ncbi:hypothetical protein GCM10009532_07430 [Microbacterium aurantiacum]
MQGLLHRLGHNLGRGPPSGLGTVGGLGVGHRISVSAPRPGTPEAAAEHTPHPHMPTKLCGTRKIKALGDAGAYVP